LIFGIFENPNPKKSWEEVERRKEEDETEGRGCWMATFY